jgi:hypothetical protein
MRPHTFDIARTCTSVCEMVMHTHRETHTRKHRYKRAHAGIRTHLAAEGSRCFLAATLPCAVGSIDVVEARDTTVDAEVVVVVLVQLLRAQLLQTIRVLRLCATHIVCAIVSVSLTCCTSIVFSGVCAASHSTAFTYTPQGNVKHTAHKSRCEDVQRNTSSTWSTSIK